MTPRLRAYLFLTLVSVIWGIAGPVIKYTENFYPPLVLLTLRFAVSTLLAIPFLISIKAHFPKDRKEKLEILAYGFISTTLALGLLFIGFSLTSALTATVIAASAPIFINLAGSLFLGEHFTKREKIGISIAFLGTVIAVAEPLLQRVPQVLGTFTGNLLIFGHLIVFTLQILMAKKILRRSISPLALSHVSFLVGFLTILPITLIFYPLSQISNFVITAPLSAHLGVLYLAIFSGTIAYSLYNKGQKTLEAGNSSIFLYLEPLWAAPLSIFWLKETISPLFILGCTTIAAGVLVAEIKKKSPH